jgi:hypothetical protein
MKQTLYQIWKQFSHPTFSYLIVKDDKGNEVFIDGYQPPDPDGGCMATGTPGGIFGRTPSGQYWFNYPTNGDENDSVWTFVKGFGQDFYVRIFETNEVLRGIEEVDNGYWVVNKRQKLLYGKSSAEKINSASLCVCCTKSLTPKKSIFSRLFS